MDARRSDWKIQPLPERHVTIALDRVYSAKETALLRRGYVPQAMEEHWFIFWEDDTLNFHRSWGGDCVFVARFEAADNGSRLVAVDVNDDPDECSENDEEFDTKMLMFLIDSLLGRRGLKVPRHPSDQRRREPQRRWKVVRGLFGKH